MQTWLVIYKTELGNTKSIEQQFPDNMSKEEIIQELGASSAIKLNK